MKYPFNAALIPTCFLFAIQGMVDHRPAELVINALAVLVNTYVVCKNK